MKYIYILLTFFTLSAHADKHDMYEKFFKDTPAEYRPDYEKFEALIDEVKAKLPEGYGKFFAKELTLMFRAGTISLPILMILQDRNLESKDAALVAAVFALALIIDRAYITTKSLG